MSSFHPSALLLARPKGTRSRSPSLRYGQIVPIHHLRAAALRPLSKFHHSLPFVIIAHPPTILTMAVDPRSYFENNDAFDVAFLFGSRARGESAPGDWDFAVLLNKGQNSRLERLAALEKLRFEIAQAVKTTADQIDLVELRDAPLNLCITISEEGQILKGHSHIELFRFYQRAWRGQEEFHFRKANGY